jgi:hypothetical protein
MARCSTIPLSAPMRNRETIDAELRLLAAVRWSVREQGGQPTSRQVDELLDERNGAIDRLVPRT